MLLLNVLVASLLAPVHIYAAATPFVQPSPSAGTGADSFVAGRVGRLVGLLTVDSPVGKLTYYGHNTTLPAAPLLAKRCGSNAVGCDGANVPKTDPCARMIYGSVDGHTDLLPDWVRAFCLNSDGGQCCISWGAPTAGLRLSTLFKAAAKTYNACVVNRKSGYTRDTGLNGVCTDQCLSNRPDGCI